MTEPDSRRVVQYLVEKESDDYVAIMGILEGSVRDLTPAEVQAELDRGGRCLDVDVVDRRLVQLKEWGAVSQRSDPSHAIRYDDLLSRNWRYTATAVGRQVQRFFRDFLAGNAPVREIPLPSLARAVAAAEKLASADAAELPSIIADLFVSQDHLDSSLVGAEDGLIALSERFDLDSEKTEQLKRMLVDYATHIALELERGSSLVFAALRIVEGRFGELASSAVEASRARGLIAHGVLEAARGGNRKDWEELVTWFHPQTGRAGRFCDRIVRALPAMHLNIRRLHTSAGTATNRAKAIALARAAHRNPDKAASMLLAALGDHPWRKLYGEAEESGSRIRSWHDAPFVDVPDLLRRTGRAGPRGRAGAPRDDRAAREHVQKERERRLAEHEAAVQEVLTVVGQPLSEAAGRVALQALLAAVWTTSAEGQRVGVKDGLGCTVVETPGIDGALSTLTWRVVTPGRSFTFHLATPSTESSRNERKEAAE